MSADRGRAFRNVANAENRYHPHCLEFMAKCNILQGKGRSIMRKRFSGSMSMIAIAAVVIGILLGGGMFLSTLQDLYK